MKHCISRIISTLMVLLSFLCLTVSANAAVQRMHGVQTPMFLGLGAAVVQTGSMEPSIPVGSLILIHEQDTYAPGDVVTYTDNSGRSITHRIVSILNDLCVTQGDANNVADPPFNESQVIGKVACVIPVVGSMIQWIQNPVIMTLIAATAIFVILPSKRAKDRM